MKEGWIYTTLGECCDINYGTRVVRSRDGGSIYDVYGGGGATFKMDTYNRENCVVISRFAMSKQCTRYVDGKFFLNDSGLTVSPKQGSNLSQLLLDKLMLALNDTIYSFGRGSAQRNLNTKEFSAMPFAYPNDLFEQERIVSYLDAQFAKIDALKANTEQQLQAAKDLFQSALKQYLTPKEGWQNKSIDDVICNLRTGLNPRVHFKLNTPDATGYYITVRELKGFDIVTDAKTDRVNEEALERINRRSNLQINDVLFSGTGTIGNTALVKEEPKTWNIKEGIYAITPKHNLIDSKYLIYYISSDIFLKYATKFAEGTGVRSIPMKRFIQLSIYIPSLKEQRDIVVILDTLSDKVARLQENYDQTITLCNDLKQALLKSIFE